MKLPLLIQVATRVGQGTLSKKFQYLVEYYDFHMVIQHPQIPFLPCHFSLCQVIFTSLDYRIGCRGEHQWTIWLSHILSSCICPSYPTTISDLFTANLKRLCGISSQDTMQSLSKSDCLPLKQLCSHSLVGLTAKAESRLAH